MSDILFIYNIDHHLAWMQISAQNQKNFTQHLTTGPRSQPNHLLLSKGAEPVEISPVSSSGPSEPDSAAPEGAPAG